MAATDFQSLLSSTNTACYLNAPPGMQRLFRLSLLENIANQLSPSTPTDYESLLQSFNIPCDISASDDRTQLLRLALLQDIVLTLGTGTGGTWTPSTPIAGTTLVEWLKGDTLTGASGSAISDWPASVGGDATQPVGSAQPNVLIGTYFHPVARFNGTSDIMGVTVSAAAGQPFTIALVFSYKGPGTGDEILNGGGAGGIGNSGGQSYIFSPTPVNLRAFDNQLHILFVVFNGAASKFAFDGAALTTTASSPGPNNWINGALNLGAGAGSLFSQVDVGEILIWSGDTSSGYSNVFNYLNQRWFIL